ncbi:hypothetical protein ACFVTY_05780 [Streptomyces sp. NPDC058067]|uniref:hypothetical protein n=1 Tax=Streptomyces sp. NPDC058067 TaxID=3346324 RepID=UPI0036EE91F7
MHAIRAASAAVLGLTALTLTAPAAFAGDSRHFEVSVSPSTVAAGGQVTLHASGCHGDTTVSSGVFDTTVIRRDSGSATATVDRDAKRSAVYSVTFACKHGPTKNVDLTIAAGRPDTPTREPERPLTPAQRGSHAGVGGTAGGFDLQKIGLGAALVAGALGSAYSWQRRRSGDHNA